MKKIIFVSLGAVALITTSLLFGQQTSLPKSSGHWQVATGGEETILLNADSGETWVLWNTQGPNGAEKYWKPILGPSATQPSHGR